MAFALICAEIERLLNDRGERIKPVTGTLARLTNEPIEVTLSSALAIPEKSLTLLVKVAGLGEALELHRDYGVICTWQSRLVGQDNMYLPPKTISEWQPKRRATKIDADRWREEVIDQLTGVWKPYTPSQHPNS